MPSSTLIRATFFALGAAVGGGAVAVLKASKNADTPSTSSTNIPTSSNPPNRPLIEVGVTGDTRFSIGPAATAGTILKYGNPGTQANTAFWFILYLPSGHGLLSFYAHVSVSYQAPFPTNSCAKHM
jgi:hypothetical protein